MQGHYGRRVEPSHDSKTLTGSGEVLPQLNGLNLNLTSDGRETNLTMSAAPSVGSPA